MADALNAENVPRPEGKTGLTDWDGDAVMERVKWFEKSQNPFADKGKRKTGSKSFRTYLTLLSLTRFRAEQRLNSTLKAFLEEAGE